MASEKNYLIHPQLILLVLLLAGLSFLFLGFSAAYLYNRFQFDLPKVQLPSLFYFNTIILLFTSYVLIRAKGAYLEDNTRQYQIFLWSTLGLSVLFLGLQILAWRQLQAMNIELTTNNMASYLYVISGLHFLHVVGGIPFLAYFIYVAHYRMKEPVSVLIYFTDPDKKRGLKLLTIYWHFLDALWIYLVLFFLVNYLI